MSYTMALMALEAHIAWIFGNVSSVASQGRTLNIIKGTSWICQRSSEELFTILQKHQAIVKTSNGHSLTMQGTKTDEICAKVRNVKDIMEYDAETAIWE